MSRPGVTLTPALDAWRRRADTARHDALWAAAAWEARGDGDALREAQAITAAAITCQDPACTHAGAGCLRRKRLCEDRSRQHRRTASVVTAGAA